MDLQQKVTAAFQERFGSAPAAIVRAPGRVNLIGEHTDYNDGFVLPMAINRAVWLAMRPNTLGRVRIYSLDFNQMLEFELEAFTKSASAWGEYLKGVAWALKEAGYPLTGWDGMMTSDVPIGAGLSSSAALELATARAFATASGFGWDPVKMALLGQRAENRWVGVNCGIMDQLISAAGCAGQALLIDCRSLETQLVPLPEGTVVIILDTATRRGLEGSAYNERRAQCETAAAYFKVKALRDITVAQFEAGAAGLGELERRRARHVVTENARTLTAADAMRRSDARELGRLMGESHVSLRDDFAVSSDALNTMVEIAQRHDACLGARMTGAGFGGCAVALVQAGGAQSFAASVGTEYERVSGLTPSIYISPPTNGAELVEPEDAAVASDPV